MFGHEFERWEQPQGPVVQQVDPARIETAAHLAYEKMRAMNVEKDVLVWPHRGETHRLLIEVFDFANGVEERWALDETGTALTKFDTPFVAFLKGLHIHLHLPRTYGLIVVGLSGVALLGAIFSGLLAHPRIFKDAFSLRIGGAKRLQEADIHNRLSVWGLPFHIVISLTGAVLGLFVLTLGVLAMVVFDGDVGKARSLVTGPPVVKNATPAPLPPVAEPLDRLLRETPGSHLERLRIIDAGTEGQQLQLWISTPGHLTGGNRYYFDGSGVQTGFRDYASGAFGSQLISALSTLHFGWYGGAPLKITYGILGLALTVVTVSGVSIWIARRRERGRPVPGLHKVWLSVVWGQPIALGVTASTALTTPHAPLLTIYLAVTVGALAPATAPMAPERLASLLRATTAGVLAATAAAHAVVWSTRIVDPMAGILDLGLLGGAAAIAVPTLLVRRTNTAPSLSTGQAAG